MHKKGLLVLLIFWCQMAACYSQSLDYRILQDINVHRNTKLDGTFKIINHTGPPICFVAGVGLAGLLHLQGKKADAYNQLVAPAANLILTIALKEIIGRPRPYSTYPAIQNLTDGGSSAFPSGHTSTAFTLATAVTLAYPEWYIAVPAYAWAGTVGYSTMHLGVHYPSDVIAGALLGSLTTYASYRLCRYLSKSEGHKKPVSI